MNRSTPALPVITNSQGSPKPMSIESEMPSNHLILCHPLLLLPSIFPSIRIFSNKSALCIRCPKYWSFSFNISPSNEDPGLASSRMDWLDLLAVQGTLKSLLQFVNVVYYVDWFVDIEESLHPWDKANLVMMYDLFNMFWILFARILLRIFASMFISDIGL